MTSKSLQQLERERFEQINGATFEKAVTLKLFNINDLDYTDGTVLLIGKTTSNASWLIQQSSASSLSQRYATIMNNSTMTDYATAWTSRASLTYGYYHLAFPA